MGKWGAVLAIAGTLLLGSNLPAQEGYKIIVNPANHYASLHTMDDPAGIARARAQFDAVFTTTANFQNADVPVKITGVGFFDYLEGQEGVAPNGVELHPIIDIIFNPYFSISSSTSSLTIAQGTSGTATINSVLSGNLNSSIALSTSGLPAGATATFSPSTIAAPGSGASTLTINVDATTPMGTYSIIISGAGGGQTHSTAINLTISNTTTQQLLGNAGFMDGDAGGHR